MSELIAYSEAPLTGTVDVFLDSTYFDHVSQRPFVTKNGFTIECYDYLEDFPGQRLMCDFLQLSHEQYQNQLTKNKLILNAEARGRRTTFYNVSKNTYEKLKKALHDLYLVHEAETLDWEVPAKDQLEMESPIRSRFVQDHLQIKLKLRQDLYAWLQKHGPFEHKGLTLTAGNAQAFSVQINLADKENFVELLKQLKETFTNSADPWIVV